MKTEIVPYTHDFLELSWQWLNDPEIMKLTNTPHFTKENQQVWFDSLNKRLDYKIWGIDVDEIHVGVCGLKNITNNDGEYWGYIGEKKLWGKGIGTFVIMTLCNYAKSQNISSVWLTVIRENQRAINLYHKLGFINEEIEDNNLLKMRIKL